jgi:hypothetical protein
MAAWPQRGFSLQTYRAMVAEATIALYEGDGAAAYALVLGGWRALRRSFLFYTQYVRADAHFLRARCALASLGSLASLAPAAVAERRARIRDAARSAEKLEREGMEWTAPLAALAAAGVALASGDRPAAVERFRDAIVRADAAEMRLHAAVARECLGDLVGGADGSALVGVARGWMASQGVRAPERMTATIAPLPLPPKAGAARS